MTQFRNELHEQQRKNNPQTLLALPSQRRTRGTKASHPLRPAEASAAAAAGAARRNSQNKLCEITKEMTFSTRRPGCSTHTPTPLQTLDASLGPAKLGCPDLSSRCPAGDHRRSPLPQPRTAALPPATTFPGLPLPPWSRRRRRCRPWWPCWESRRRRDEEPGGCVCGQHGGVRRDAGWSWGGGGGREGGRRRAASPRLAALTGLPAQQSPPPGPEEGKMVWRKKKKGRKKGARRVLDEPRETYTGEGAAVPWRREAALRRLGGPGRGRRLREGVKERRGGHPRPPPSAGAGKQAERPGPGRAGAAPDPPWQRPPPSPHGRLLPLTAAAFPSRPPGRERPTRPRAPPLPLPALQQPPLHPGNTAFSFTRGRGAPFLASPVVGEHQAAPGLAQGGWSQPAASYPPAPAWRGDRSSLGCVDVTGQWYLELRISFENLFQRESRCPSAVSARANGQDRLGIHSRSSPSRNYCVFHTNKSIKETRIGTAAVGLPAAELAPLRRGPGLRALLGECRIAGLSAQKAQRDTASHRAPQFHGTLFHRLY